MKKGWSSFMDRRVKERLIGATILVVIVILIVPELLSGPKRSAGPAGPLIPAAAGPTEPIRNVIVDLATSKATADQASGASVASPGPAGASSGAATPSAVATSDQAVRASQPKPPLPAVAQPVGPPVISTLKAQQPAASPPDSETAAPQSPAVSEKPSAPREAPAADMAHHAWSVQLGSFASKSNAETLARRLRADKLPAYVSSIGAGSSVRYRVRVGPMADRNAAERTMVKLKKEGHAATLVAP
jgi:DedD protein